MLTYRARSTWRVLTQVSYRDCPDMYIYFFVTRAIVTRDSHPLETTPRRGGDPLDGSVTSITALLRAVNIRVSSHATEINAVPSSPYQTPSFEVLKLHEPETEEPGWSAVQRPHR